MFSNFNLSDEELCTRSIRHSQLGRWTLRIAVLGILLAIVQGIALSILDKKNEQSHLSEKDIMAKYEQFTKKLPSLKKAEEAAREVLKFRAHSKDTFMPTGVYYALADSLLPGMALKEAHLIKQPGAGIIYNLKLTVGCDSASIGHKDFVDTFSRNMNKYYNGQLSAVLKSVTQGKTTTIADTIVSEQTLEMELRTAQQPSNDTKKAKK